MFKLKVAGDEKTQFIFLDCGNNAGPVLAERGKPLGGAYTGGMSELWKYSEYKNDPENWTFHKYEKVLQHIKLFESNKKTKIDRDRFKEFYSETISMDKKQMKLIHNKIYVLNYGDPNLLYYVIDDEKALVIGGEKNKVNTVTHSLNREYDLKQWKISEFKNDFENWNLYNLEDLDCTLAVKLKQTKNIKC